MVLLLFQVLFIKRKPLPTPPQEPVKEQQTIKQESQVSPSELPAEEKLSEQKQIQEPVLETSEMNIVINTSKYQAVWSNKGGVLKSWKLKDYRQEKHDENNLLELVPPESEEIQEFPFFIDTGDQAFNDYINKNLFYKSSSSSLTIDDGEKKTIRFTYSDGKGTSVEKAFTFYGGDYDLDIEIYVRKEGENIPYRILWGPGLGITDLNQQKRRFGAVKGIALMQAKKVVHKAERKYKLEDSIFHFASWAAYEDQYFTAIFVLPPLQNNVQFLRKEKDAKAYFFLSVSQPTRAYVGPKDFDRLGTFGYETKKIIKFGFFGFIAEILLRAIKLIHKAFPNWGISIIILTIITKLLFFPLTYSSTRSMSKMQELQPKIKALRAKYKKSKHDIAQRRKMNEEMMRLYKEHGINPAGGCLPILVQIPVFWGFFRLLAVSIEFRHSPFVFWIKDLSVKDPYYVTPILMGISQYISQKMTPTSADPTQARMMLIMPVIMTIFFMNFQSGLVLYWLTSNILQIGQQAIMNRLMKKKKRETHGKRRK